ncbi:uncharacterized protein LOC136091350 [Hydra vulgaris]|uniref:Uncharacterized protein LOC136091350 n=1 Tax=Hydra vulgaris TaxID=6087 RepID=A0ABM4DK34_HYDVU
MESVASPTTVENDPSLMSSLINAELSLKNLDFDIQPLRIMHSNEAESPLSNNEVTIKSNNNNVEHNFIGLGDLCSIELNNLLQGAKTIQQNKPSFGNL